MSLYTDLADCLEAAAPIVDPTNVSFEGLCEAASVSEDEIINFLKGRDEAEVNMG